ncbi:MAG: LptF/LptG family permease [Acidobacteriota bacterium]|nr:LptF/LptG family permease [Acidobacteriota bacterium]
MLKIKSIDRYLLKEIASPFGIGLLVYTFTLLINMILILSERLISKDVSGMTLVKILIYLLPDLLSFTIPMATLMGVLAGLSRMSTDSEIVAFKTLGVNNSRILRPIMIFSAVGWLLSSYLIMYLAPEANFRFSQLNTNIILSKSVADIKSRVLNKDFYPYTIYFDDLDHNTGEWINVFLYTRKQGNTDTVILAKRGKFLQDPREEDRYIMMQDAWVHSFNTKEPDKSYDCTYWGRMKEKISKRQEIKQSRRHTQFVFPQLVKKMKEEPQNMLFTIEYHRKFALPFACLAMGFLALSLGISTKKGGKISGFIISLAIIFVYYSIITASQNLVMKKFVPPFLGMWAADIFLVVSGIIAYYYTSKEKTIDWERLFVFLERAKKRFSLTEKARKKAEGEKIPGPKGKEKGKVVLVIKIRKFSFRVLNILDLYVVRRLLTTFVFIFVSMTLVFYIVTIMELVDNVIENQVAFYYLLQYIYYYTPEIIKFVLPVSVLTAVLLTFSMMSKNNEIVAVQVSGISLYRLAFPAIVIGVLLSLGYFYIQEAIAPNANRKALKTMDIIRKQVSPEEQEFHKNWVVGDNNEFYFYDFLNTKLNKYVQFNVISLDKNFNIKKRISSQFARWKSPTGLMLESGFERNFENNNPLDYIEFRRKEIDITGGESLFLSKVKDYRYMNINELKEYIRYLEKNKSETVRYEAQLHNKYAFPFASLVMVLIAIPFSFTMGKKGTLYGIGFAIGISIIFWGAFGIFSALGSTALLSPFVSAFAPLFIFSAISIYLFINLKT